MLAKSTFVTQEPGWYFRVGKSEFNNEIQLVQQSFAVSFYLNDDQEWSRTESNSGTENGYKYIIDQEYYEKLLNAAHERHFDIVSKEMLKIPDDKLQPGCFWKAMSPRELLFSTSKTPKLTEQYSWFFRTSDNRPNNIVLEYAVPVTSLQNIKNTVEPCSSTDTDICYNTSGRALVQAALKHYPYLKLDKLKWPSENAMSTSKQIWY